MKDPPTIEATIKISQQALDAMREQWNKDKKGEICDSFEEWLGYPIYYYLDFMPDSKKRIQKKMSEIMKDISVLQRIGDGLENLDELIEEEIHDDSQLGRFADLY